jgi:hypothetical protein
MSSVEAPPWITAFREAIPESYLRIADEVWAKQAAFVEWPDRSLLFMPGIIRVKYHQYSIEQLAQIKAAGVHPDTRSNGPAIMAFAVAGGRRPWRASGRKQWSIHHIYDGQHPAPHATKCTRAVVDGNYFTASAGLVAIHPIADALADELAWFAWLLRYEAFCRFSFDPDAGFAAGLISA